MRYLTSQYVQHLELGVFATFKSYGGARWVSELARKPEATAEIATVVEFEGRLYERQPGGLSWDLLEL